MLGQWQEFYFGITGRLAFDENQRNRWNDASHGHCWNGWVKMILLYSSPNAHKSIHDGTGRMEDELIQLFQELPECLNQKRGGGGASTTKGQPHFTYLVVR